MVSPVTPAASGREGRRPLIFLPWAFSYAVGATPEILNPIDRGQLIDGWLTATCSLAMVAGAVVSVARREAWKITRRWWILMLAMDTLAAVTRLVDDHLRWPVRITSCVLISAATLWLYFDQRNTAWRQPSH